MTAIEMRKTKAELHCELVDMVLSRGGTLEDDVQMWQYIIQQASNELTRIILEKN